MTTIYLAPLTLKLPADYVGPVVDGGLFVERLVSMTKVDQAIVLLKPEDVQFLSQYSRYIFPDAEVKLEVLLNAPKVEYTSEWILAAQLTARASYDEVIAKDRSERATTLAKTDRDAKTFDHLKEEEDTSLFTSNEHKALDTSEPQRLARQIQAAEEALQEEEESFSYTEGTD